MKKLPCLEHLDIETCYNLGLSLKEEGRFAEAEQCFRWVVDRAPELPDPRHCLGVLLQLQGNLTDAIEQYRIAIRLDPIYVKAHYNLAVSLWRSGSYHAAITALQDTIACDPSHREAHWLLGMLLLMTGNFPDGWREYEWRWGANGGPPPPPELGCPEWDGSPLNGRTLLIHMEQGRGDMIQFVRYAPLAAALGGRVVIASLKELVSLLSTTQGLSQVVDRNEPLPPFDLHIPVLSLPRVLGATIETIPANTPYLYPHPEDVAAWGCKMANDGPDQFRIGIVWSGNEQPDANRTCPAEFLAGLLEIPQTRFYSLQIGNQERFPLNPEFSSRLIDYTADINDFSDTAALIANLDLVISIDTAVAHLAGSLGKSVWTLLPFVPDWRWMLESSDTPWYPTMRLFRQTSAGDWAGVVERVRQELLQLIDSADRYNRCGIDMLNSGHVAEAVQAFTKAIELAPEHFEAHCNLGVALDSMQRYEEAVRCYQAALAYKPDFLQALFNMGNAFRSMDNLDAASACFEKTIELAPGLVPAYLCLGEIYKKNKRFTRAKHVFERALYIDPDNSDAWQGLGETFQAREEFDQAIAAYRRALSIKPGRANSLNMLGAVYQCQGKLDDAESCYRQALAIAPDRPTILNNLGTVLSAQGRQQEAVVVFQRLLEIDSDFAEAHWNLALALLGMGKYSEGWPEYEWRFRKVQPVPERNFSQPRWDGSHLQGKTILLHSEQGFGDTLQFARYVPLVAQRGGKVILECQTQALKRLLCSLEGVALVVTAGDQLPSFDYHLPLLSLPLIFETTLDTIPQHIPYLAAEPSDVDIWWLRMKKTDAFKVGLVWCGRQGQVLNRKRSCPLENFAPLATVPNVEFYSLQIGEGTEQLKECHPDFIIRDLTAHIHDFADTAAFMANLDLIITIDTAVAHLAGAVGARTWILLPYGADWRWLNAGEKTPWYPSMRLFRQPIIGDWQSVMHSVEAELKKMVSRSNPFMEGRVLPATPGGALANPVSAAAGAGKITSERSARKPLLVGLAWSGRQDNPLNRKRACPFSALYPLFDVPGVTFVSLQLEKSDKDGEHCKALLDLTANIKDFEDTAALMANLDLIISIDTSVAHLAGAMGRPAWVLLSHVADWRWLQNQVASPWYPEIRLFRQPDFGDWDSVVLNVAHMLANMTGNPVSMVNQLDEFNRAYSGISMEQRHLEQMLETHREALAMNTSSPDAHLDVGAALALLGRHEEAIVFYNRVLELEPNSVTAHLNLAYSLLTLGSYNEGWHHFEWRCRRIPDGQIPAWPILNKDILGMHRAGTSLLVHCEQGFGDTIQFARFLPLLADAGYRVVVSSQPSMAALLASVRGVSQVVPHGELLPVCDLQVLLLSLPGLFSITPDNMPVETPYLIPRQQLLEGWKTRLDAVL